MEGKHKGFPKLKIFRVFQRSNPVFNFWQKRLLLFATQLGVTMYSVRNHPTHHPSGTQPCLILPKLLIFQVDHQIISCLSVLEELKNGVRPCWRYFFSDPATTHPPNKSRVMSHESWVKRQEWRVIGEWSVECGEAEMGERRVKRQEWVKSEEWVKSTEYRVQCTEYSVQSTVYRVQCTEYSVHSTVYRVQCT